MTTTPEDASIARVDELLSKEAGWKSCGGWEVSFYKEIHEILFKGNQNADVIANWYLKPLLRASIFSVEDINRATEAFSNVVGNMPAVVGFFERHFDIPDSTPPKMVSLKIRHGNKEKNEEMDRKKLAIKNLEALVRTMFNIPLAALKLHIDT